MSDVARLVCAVLCAGNELINGGIHVIRQPRWARMSPVFFLFLSFLIFFTTNDLLFLFIFIYCF